jgi:hypothetical protein
MPLECQAYSQIILATDLRPVFSFLTALCLTAELTLRTPVQPLLQWKLSESKKNGIPKK